MLKVTADKAADAVYIQLTDSPFSFSRELGAETIIDYSPDGVPLGVEFIGTSLFDVDWDSLKDLIAPYVCQAVSVRDNQIVAEPSTMITGLGYPIIYQGHEWWVIKTEKGTLKMLKGDKI